MTTRTGRCGNRLTVVCPLPGDSLVSCSLPARHAGWHRDRDSGVEWSRQPTIRGALAALLDVLMGPKCVRCTQRVFPRDALTHTRVCGGRPAHRPTGATS